MTRNPRSRRLLAALGSVLLLGLAACSTPLPQPAPEPVPAVAPAAATVVQSQDVLGEVGAVPRLRGRRATTPPGPPRVEGPALAVRTAEYVRNHGDGGREAADGAADRRSGADRAADRRVAADPAGRHRAARRPAGAARAGDAAERPARSQYRLWGWGQPWARASDAGDGGARDGQPDPRPDATGLVMTPTEALQQYADVLANGDASTFAATFAPDAFRSSIETARAATAAGCRRPAPRPRRTRPAGSPSSRSVPSTAARSSSVSSRPSPP